VVQIDCTRGVGGWRGREGGGEGLQYIPVNLVNKLN